ncbi:MAG: transposase [Caldilineaceae bacterium]
MNNTRKGGEKPVLLSEVVGLVAKCQEGYGQERVFNRVLGLVMGELFALGRHTITQMLLMLGLTEEDWSAWYRVFSEGRFAEEASSRVLLREQLSEVSASEPFVVGLDGFPVPRESQTMPGTGWMRGLRTAKFRPGIQRGQRFVEGSWLPPIVKGYSRALPIRSLPAFTAENGAVCGGGAVYRVAAGLALLGWIRAEWTKLAGVSKRC